MMVICSLTILEPAKVLSMSMMAILFSRTVHANRLLTSNDGDVLSTATTYSGNTAITCKDGDVLFYRAADVLKPLSLKLETNDGEIIVPLHFPEK